MSRHAPRHGWDDMMELGLDAARRIAAQGVDFAKELGAVRGVGSVPPVSMVKSGSSYNRLTGRLLIAREAFRDHATLVAEVGHELGHRISDAHVGWPGITSIEQAGAVSEGLSEIFGGLLGQRLARTDAERAAALAGISARGEVEKIGGELVPRARHMREYRRMFHDSGGIHFNAGIPREAAWLVNTQLGLEPAADLWLATIERLDRFPRFRELVSAQVAAADELAPRHPKLPQATRDALSAVGLIDR